MIENRGRRIFFRKCLVLSSGLSLYGCGGSSSDSTTFTPSSPVITLQPADQSVSLGESVTFQAQASGSEPLSYQWRRNGADIPRATSNSYTTPPVAPGDDAGFSVIVTNAAGTAASREARLYVIELVVPPSISIQPADRAITTGERATFQVQAQGTEPLSYQWFRDGQAITSASGASYTTAPAALGDDAVVFSVTVSNSAGAVSSIEAMLTVVSRAVTVDSTIITVDSSTLTVDAA